jgi:hypothetical protein
VNTEDRAFFFTIPVGTIPFLKPGILATLAYCFRAFSKRGKIVFLLHGHGQLIV